MKEGKLMEEVKIGATLPLQDQEGRVHPAKVMSMTDESITMDVNHPLADQDLHFTGKVVDTREATEDEVSHGHVHGPRRTRSLREMKGAKSAEQYLIKNPQWSACLVLLRELVLSISGFTETIKWGIPVYEYKGKNVAGIAAFKAHVALWFYQGALLEDRSNVLMNAQEEITVAHAAMEV